MTKRPISTFARPCLYLCIPMALIATGPARGWGYTDLYPGRERVLMLGDSITIQPNAVAQLVQQAFAGLANVQIIPENFQDTDYALSDVSPGVSRIESWINGETWNVIDFNTGLHDMKVGQPQYDPPAAYAVKLGQVVDEIKTHSGSATLLWRETTFVPNPEGNNRHLALDGVTPHDNVHRYYNAAAAPVIAAKGITLVDSTAAISESAERTAANNVHYTDAGYRQLAPPVIENIFNQLHLPSGLCVDFGLPGTGGDVAQDGFHDFKCSDSTTWFLATDLGGHNQVSVSVANLAVNGSRDRGAVGGAGAALSDVLRDFIFAGSGSGPLSVTISGLKAGNYTFTGYFHDNDRYQGVADVEVSVDDGLSYTDGMSVICSTGASPTSIGTGQFAFSCNGVDDVVLRVLVDKSGGGNGASLLNGFQLLPTLPGDADLSGTVDDLDAGILAAHWLQRTGSRWMDGDFNADGAVDDRDAAILAAHWQRGGQQEATVPEPTTIVLLLGAAIACLIPRARGSIARSRAGS